MFHNQQSIIWPTKWCSHSILSAVTNRATYSIWLLGRVSYYHESISAMWHQWNLSAISFMGSVFFSATQWHHSWFKQCLYDRWFVKHVCTRQQNGKQTMMCPEVYFMDCTGRAYHQKRELFISVVQSPSRKCYMSNVTVIPSGDYIFIFSYHYNR